MPAFTTIALAALTAAGVGGQIYSGIKQDEANDDNRKYMAEQKAKQDQALADEKKRQSDQEKADAAELQRDQLRATQKSQAMAAQGRRGTILTSPLGAPSTNAVSNKQLLGL